MRRLDSVPRVLAVGVVLLVLMVLVVALRPKADRTTATAYFPRTVSLYPGSDVRILGVKVGEVDRVTPVGKSVRVTFWWDAKHKVPANAKAAIVSPAIVADRYIQLTPVYRGGAAIADGAQFPLDRTAVPLELDQVYSSLNDLSVALGPKGANDQGALSRLLEVSARNLDGQGLKVNNTITDYAALSRTLGGQSGDLFTTVRQLQTFVSALAANDSLVRQFNASFAATSQTLAGERTDLRKSLSMLATALAEVTTFVRDNRGALRNTVHQATVLSEVLATEKDALAEVLDDAPQALNNLSHTYNPKSATLDTRMNLEQANDPALLLCSLLRQAKQPMSTCQALKGVLDMIPKLGAPQGGSPAGSAPVMPSRDNVDPTLGGIAGGGR
jgi:phospholipid/cholesterol/gamma-HCH transport system substrate-binding protein